MTVKQFLKDYDFDQAIGVSNFAKNDKYGNAETFRAGITRVLAYDHGENDGDAYIALIELGKGETYAFLEASCDYTGWDCQAGGFVDFNTLEHFLGPLGMTAEYRVRLGATLDASGLEFAA